MNDGQRTCHTTSTANQKRTQKAITKVQIETVMQICLICSLVKAEEIRLFNR